MKKRYMDCPLSLKSISEEGRFAGYASVFNVVDKQRDIMQPGAFLKTIQGRTGEVKLLWQHDFSEPIGIITRLFEDARGLYVEGTLLLDVARAKETYTLLKAGAVSGLSIGYTPIEFAIEPDTGVRKLSQVELWEVSLVTFPANAAAGVTVVKQYAAIEQVMPDDWRTAQQTGRLIELCDALERARAVLTI